jgi:adenylate kinase
MKTIIFIAPPAAGKGIQSQLLSDKYKFEHISTGNLLRDEMTMRSDFGNHIKEIMGQGKLVDDNIVIALLENKIRQSNNDYGYILDGFPRTVNQAVLYDNLSSKLNCKIDYVFFLNINQEEAMKRALGRLTCPRCGTIYNEFFDTFETNGVCDKCKIKLERRNDDNEETFTKRFDDYLENTQPLIEYYKSKGLLHIIDSSKNKEYTFIQIEDVLNKG